MHAGYTWDARMKHEIGADSAAQAQLPEPGALMTTSKGTVKQTLFFKFWLGCVMVVDTRDSEIPD
jgi:hypothetical protein